MQVDRPQPPAFSLVELIVVIVIIGLLSAMAIPRMSRGTAGAASTALAGDLRMIREALNRFAAEHDGTYPAGATFPLFQQQLTLYSDLSGTSTRSTKDATHRFGPYLERIPKCPVGNKSAVVKFDPANDPPATGGNQGWAYNPNTGAFISNSDDTDDEGKAYSTY